MHATASEARDRYEKLRIQVQTVMEKVVIVLKRHGVEHKEVEEACVEWCSSIQKLLDWVNEIEKTVAEQTGTPADVKQLEEQIEEQKVCGKEFFFHVHFIPLISSDWGSCG